MRKTLLTILSLILITAGAVISEAQTSTKIINLKDGSSIAGEVTSFANGTYFIKTSFGQIQVKDEEILSISQPPAGSQARQNLQTNPLTPPSLNSSEIKGIQNQLLSDPQLIAELQSLLTDKEVMSALENSEFLDAVMSMDPVRIQNNRLTGELLNNPKIKRLMEKISTKLINQQ